MKFGYFLLYMLLFFSSCVNNSTKKKKVASSVGEELKMTADKYYDSNNYIKAIFLYTKLISIDSTKGEFYYKRGYSYSMIFDVEQAVKDYSKAISLGYRVSSAYKNIGINYSSINDTLAINNLKKSLKYERDITERRKISLLIANCSQRIKKN